MIKTHSRQPGQTKDFINTQHIKEVAFYNHNWAVIFFFFNKYINMKVYETEKYNFFEILSRDKQNKDI